MGRIGNYIHPLWELLKGKSKDTDTIPVPEPVVICSSLDDLLFTDFVKCACEADYLPLIRHGLPTADELIIAWIPLVSEFNTIIDSGEATKLNDLCASIEGYNLKIDMVTALIEAMRLGYCEDFAECLRNDWGYDLPLSKETLENDLKKVEGRLGNEKTQLAIKLKQYNTEQLKKQEAGDSSMTKEHYMHALYAIEEHKKMEFDLGKYTAYKFAVHYKQLISYQRLLKSKYSGNGTK